MRRRRSDLRLECLETRLTPSTWTGAGANTDWMTGANWSGGAAPQNGASLVFPAGVTKMNAVNDFPAGMTFNSIEIDGSGYALSGNAVVLAQGISTTYASGASSDAIDTQLGGTISLAAGGELDLNGALTGSAGLTVAGGGTLGLGGSANNTYSGTTTDGGSTIVLDKSGGATAVAGDLVIGDGSTAATVRLGAANQTVTTAAITINDHGILDLNGNNDTIGKLTLTGGTVTTGAGTLTLGGDLTTDAPTGSDASSIGGKLALGGATPTITVANGTAATDLSIPAVIGGSTTSLTVTGGGTVDLSGKDTYSGTTTVQGAGTTLIVDGTVGPLQLNAGTTLGGSGTVGNVNSTGGIVNPGDGTGPLGTGTLTLNASSSFAPVLVGPASNAQGQVSAAGAVTLGGTLNVTLAPTYLPTAGDQVTIIRNNSGSGVTGTFLGLPEGSTLMIGNRPFRITYQGGAGHDVVLSSLGYTTTTTISTTTQTSTYGQSVSFSVVVSASGGPASTGGVAFFDGNPTAGGKLLGTVPLHGQGVAAFTTGALHVAGSPHQIFAEYLGSTNDAGSTSTQPASVTITPAPLTASLTGTVSKAYDGTTSATLAGNNFTLSGVVGNDVVSLTSQTFGAYDTKDVGTGKTVTANGLSISGANAGDYTLTSSSVSGPVGVIRAASLTVTGVTAQPKVYDGTTSAVIDTASAALSGVIAGDVVSLVTGAAVGSFVDANVGNQQVTVRGLSLSGPDAGNYTITSATATASITPAPLTVTANPATMIYGGTVPALTYSTTGLVGADTKATALSGSPATAATPLSHVGSYPITQGSLTSVGGDYTITFAGSSLSITPAPLTITANDVMRVYGAPLPPLTAAYSGLVNHDTAAKLTSPPILATSATATSPVGVYPITVSGARSGDYTITYLPGALTVTKAGTSAGLTGAVATSVVGQAVTFTVQVAPSSPGSGDPTGSVTFFADGNPVATAPLNAATGQASFSTTSLAPGSHAITAAYSGDSNFTSVRSGSTQEFVSAAATTTVLTTRAIRNKRGKIVEVMLESRVVVVSPGGGTPTGVVTYFRGVKPITTAALGDGMAVVTLKSNRALKRRFSVRFNGVDGFLASSSATVVVSKKTAALSARPTAGFLRSETVEGGLRR